MSAIDWNGNTYELLSREEVLGEKLTIWQLTLKRATTTAHRAECERAIADLTAKLAAVREP